MIPSMTAVLNELDAELSEEGRLKAWAWADKNLDRAWSKAEDRLYSVVTEKKSDRLAQELELYKQAIKDLIFQYKSEHKISSVKSFLQSIASSTQHPLSKIEIVEKVPQYSYRSVFDLSPVTRMIPGKTISQDMVPVSKELVCELSQQKNEKNSKQTTLPGFGRRLRK